ncbi:hypothetical protein EES39_33790 [Streptomyces sp. ADI92-24]|nr:hypothetical protein EDD95_5464 [Streptomyces sp. CEV 2-1]RPK35055.1 hypothetical protein EES39_33790 [Streptomyces sp. ADI92-24]
MTVDMSPEGGGAVDMCTSCYDAMQHEIDEDVQR